MSFYTDVLKKDPRFNSTEPVKDVGLLEPGTRKAVAAFIEAAKSQGHDVRIAETFRSQARQHQLFERKLTQLSKVGCHGFGVAVDLQLFVPRQADGKPIYDPIGEHYAFFQSLAVAVGMISGIGWGTPKARHTFTDWDHLQRVPVFRQDAMFAGAWFPGEIYDPYEDMRQRHVPGMADAGAPKVIGSGPAQTVHPIGR